MRCGVCKNPKRVAIEEACTKTPIATVASEFRLSETALTKHLASHPRAVAAADVPEAASAETKRTRRRAPTPVVEDDAEQDRSPDTVRSQRQGLSARARAIAIAETIDRLLVEAEADVDEDGASSASYAEKASLVRAAIAANRQLAQLTGELGVSEASVLASPIVQTLVTNIVGALKDHPEAAKSVLELLERRSIRSEAA